MPLTRKRPRPAVENDEFAAFVRRVIRAWGRRVAAGDVDAVADMAAAAGELDTVLRDAVAGLRAKGYSWAEIAARLGVTRQAAHQRWGRDRGRRDRNTVRAVRPVSSADASNGSSDA
jgi:hypothetical protein